MLCFLCQYKNYRNTRNAGYTRNIFYKHFFDNHLYGPLKHVAELSAIAKEVGSHPVNHAPVLQQVVLVIMIMMVMMMVMMVMVVMMTTITVHQHNYY